MWQELVERRSSALANFDARRDPREVEAGSAAYI